MRDGARRQTTSSEPRLNSKLLSHAKNNGVTHGRTQRFFCRRHEQGRVAETLAMGNPSSWPPHSDRIFERLLRNGDGSQASGANSLAAVAERVPGGPALKIGGKQLRRRAGGFRGARYGSKADMGVQAAVPDSYR